MIEVEKYQQKAAVAADALRAALIAVEDCGADVELTNIVMHLDDDRTKLCRLFDLPPEQAFQVERLTPKKPGPQPPPKPAGDNTSAPALAACGSGPTRRPTMESAEHTAPLDETHYVGDGCEPAHTLPSEVEKRQAQRWRKKPVVIDAVRFTDVDSASVVIGWMLEHDAIARYHEHLPAEEFDDGKGHPEDPEHLSIDTLEGTMRADVGDWIIRGVQGEFYPCKPDIFLATYEPVALCRACHYGHHLSCEDEKCECSHGR